MKKKIYYILALAALTLVMPCFTSCSDDTSVSDVAHVRFCGELPADPLTRAFGDASNIDSLIVGIFNDQQVETGRYSFPVSEGVFDIDIALMKGHTYNLVFWAQSSSCKTYDTSDLKQIRMKADEEALTLSDAECKDAFFYIWKDLDLDKNIASYNLTLYRPLAQINVGRETEAAPASLTLNGMPDTFNTFENEVSGSETFTWNFPETAEGQTMEVEGKEYKRIALTYVFVPNTAKTVAGALVLTNNATSAEQTFTLDAVTLQLNKRTNIVGQFLFAP